MNSEVLTNEYSIEKLLEINNLRSGYDGVPIVRNDNAQTDSNKRWEYVKFCTVCIVSSMV